MMPTEMCDADEPHQIHSYTLLFSLFLHFLYITDPLLCTSALTQLHAIALTWQSHSLHQTNLAYLMDTWLMIHMYLLLFLVSPTCPLLQSDQSWALTPCSQALFLTLPYAHFLVFHSYLTCLYLPFKGKSSPKPQQIAYMSLPQNWDLALTPCTVSHLFRTVVHHITLPQSHHLYLPQYTWRQSLTPRLHPLRAP